MTRVDRFLFLLIREIVISQVKKQGSSSKIKVWIWRARRGQLSPTRGHYWRSPSAAIRQCHRDRSCVSPNRKVVADVGSHIYFSCSRWIGYEWKDHWNRVTCNSKRDKEGWVIGSMFKSLAIIMRFGTASWRYCKTSFQIIVLALWNCDLFILSETLVYRVSCKR